MTPQAHPNTRSMTDTKYSSDPGFGSAGTDWRGSVRRRWPLIVAALVILAAAIWWLTRDKGTAKDSEAATEEAAHADTVVSLDSAALRLAGVEVMTVGASSGGALTANGTITYDANHVSVLSSRAEGRVVSVRADLGQEVSAGTTLAIIESSEIGKTRGELERARVTVDAARRNYEREKRLFDQSISSQKELLEAEAEFRSAEADYASSLSSLRALGATGGQGATFGLSAPISGTVVERTASPGQVVGPSTNLFTVADLRHVWIEVDVYESDLSRVRKGAEATVTPAALTGESFVGKVTYAGGIVDPTSRTFKVRVELENAARRLRPGMFAQVRIAAPPGAAAREGSAISVPDVAIQDVDGKPVVFVQTSTAGRFIARPVILDAGGRASGGMVTVNAGLRTGDRVVTTGAFQLKSEMMKGSLSAEH